MQRRRGAFLCPLVLRAQPESMGSNYIDEVCGQRWSVVTVAVPPCSKIRALFERSAAEDIALDDQRNVSTAITRNFILIWPSTIDECETVTVPLQVS